MRGNKKLEVIKVYVNNPKVSSEDISIIVGCHRNFAEKTVLEYKEHISYHTKLHLVKSLDLPNIYYLFTDVEEKKLKIINNKIKGVSLLTEYELMWLELNYKFINCGDYNETPDLEEEKAVERAVLTTQQVLEIRNFYDNEKVRICELSRAYNITRSLVGKIVHRVTWKNI